MPLDIRAEAAKFYDLSPDHPADLPFYVRRLPSPGARVLELGCGTGRISLPLAGHCSFLHALELSGTMLEIFRAKLEAAGLGEDRIVVEQADITGFDLGERFDLIIAPYRVIQNLETDDQLAGLFLSIRRHLGTSGRCILNAFHPNRPPEAMRTEWVRDEEQLWWEVEVDGGRVTCHEVRRRLVPDPLVLYPELIYRRYSGPELVEQSVLTIPMRCFYPDEFLGLIRGQGFEVLEKWGGYDGEEYGAGGELIVEFSIEP